MLPGFTALMDSYRCSRPMLASFQFLPALLCLSASVMAQEEPDEDALELQRFAVTGYSIKRSEIEGPAPVDFYPREEIEQSGANTLGEFFRYLPQAMGQVSETFQGSGFAGADFINLRGIGIDNTLTLLNGRRVSGYARNGASEPFVDVNSIPVAAIDRIEILKDGASAIYGADAIAGVVNIILRDTFDGLQVSGGYLVTSQGDGQDYNADVVWGRNYDRTSFLATLSFMDKSPILARDRERTADVDFSDQGGPNFRSFNGTPSNYLLLDRFEIRPDPECGADPNISGIETFPFFGDVCLFNFAYFQQLTYDRQSLSSSFVLKHEFNNRISGRAELFYTTRDTLARLAPSPVIGGFIPADHPNNPFGAPLVPAGRPLDTGDRLFDTATDTYRLLVGFEGSWKNWDWSADMITSGNDVKTRRINAVFADRYQAALLGKGGDGGNLFYNPFGANPQNDPELIDWLTTTTTFGAQTAENSLELKGSTFFGNLPGGPVGFAAGLQYRQQDLDEFADDIERSGRLAGGSQVTQIQADRNILAAYVEFSLPLFSTLEAQLALRHDDYSDFGGTTNPKLALAWRPSRDWLLRATYSTSFRPPTFTELFNPPVLNSGFFVDTERCAVTGAQQDCAPREYPVLSVGNPDLQPEEGDAVFVGIVWSPEYLAGFDIELDYWRFEHTERIIKLNPQLILDAKGDNGVSRAPPSEEDIAAGIAGPILQLTTPFENSDTLVTSGIDLTARYSRQTRSAGIFSFSVLYTYVGEYRLNEASLGSAAAGINFAGKHFNGQFGIPRHRGNVNFGWQFGAHNVATNIHYVGEYEGFFNQFENGVQTDTPFIVEQITTLDVQYTYALGNRRTRVLLGCKNCTDKSPPVTFLFTGEGLYDYRGATLYTRVEHRF